MLYIIDAQCAMMIPMYWRKEPFIRRDLRARKGYFRPFPFSQIKK